MDKRELRIGNLIYIHWKPFIVNSIIKTDSVSGFELYIEGNDDYDYSIYAEPIPLNEEWLLKFGFEWDIYYQGKIKDGFKYVVKEGYKEGKPCGYNIGIFREPYVIAENVEFVHQLQNLYFALTGSELEIKELVK